jgi:DNA-binding NarL/FixJ family response regulator
VRVAIIEDEALVAMDMTSAVRGHGHEVVGPFGRIEEVAALSVAEAPEMAFVDLRLGARRCGTRVDRYLHERFGTVSIYVTGDPEIACRRGTCAVGIPVKPVCAAEIGEAIRHLAGFREGAAAPPRAPGALRRIEPVGAMTTA